MKKGWDKYATENRYIKKGYLRKYRNGSSCWETSETSGSNCLQQSRKEEIEVKIEQYATVEIADKTERPEDDERIIQRVLDMPVIPAKQIKRKRKAVNHPPNG